MVGRRVIVAKPWNPSPVATSVESCSSTSSEESDASESCETASSSFFTTTGTPTINTALREGGMPEVVLHSDSWETVSSDYDSSASSVGRQSAGRELDPRDRDSIVVTISDRDRDRKTGSEGSDRQNSGAGCPGEELCCLHGRPCALGRPGAEAKQFREVKVPGYEPVKIDRLENPPESFTRRRSERNRTPETQPSNTSSTPPPKSGIVYRCRMPSDMSSLASPALPSMSHNSTAPSDGIYENIDCFNQLNNLPTIAPSQTSVQTARDTTVLSHPDPRRRQPSPTLSDFYLGAMRKRDAEKRVKRRTYFRLYHRVPSNAYSDLTNLRDHVSLYIVYKTSKGGYCHYPIQRVRGETPAGYKSTKYFYVDCMEELPPRFNSLDALVRFYSVYVQLDLVEKAGDVEVFPVPKRDDDGEKRHRQKDRRY